MKLNILTRSDIQEVLSPPCLQEDLHQPYHQLHNVQCGRLTIYNFNSFHGTHSSNRYVFITSINTWTLHVPLSWYPIYFCACIPVHYIHYISCLHPSFSSFGEKVEKIKKLPIISQYLPSQESFSHSSIWIFAIL